MLALPADVDKAHDRRPRDVERGHDADRARCRSVVVELRGQPAAVDNVPLDHTAGPGFPAFSARTAPQTDAAVERAAADVRQGAKTGTSVCTARSRLDGAQLTRLVPGMAFEAYRGLGERSGTNDLVKPLTDPIVTAWLGRRLRTGFARCVTVRRLPRGLTRRVSG